MLLHFEDTGSGPVVVLLHGGGVDLRMWDAQVPVLVAAGYRVIRADARGHGRSETPTAPFRQCDDVAELLRERDVARATLVGLSMGAGAATDTALEHPELVAGLVVCGAGTNEPVFVDPWLTGLQAEMAEAQRRLDAPAWIELFLRALVVGPQREPGEMDQDVLGRCREMVTATVANHVRPDAVRPSHVAGSWGRLGEIGVPALGIYGTLDAADHLAMVERFAASVPGAGLAAVEGAAHMPPMEQPAAFNELLLRFLRS